MKKLWLALSLLLFASQAFTQNEKCLNISFTKKNLEQNPIKLSKLATEISYVKLETNASALIGQAGNYSTLMIPGGFVLINRREKQDLLVFNEDGSFRIQLGSIGKGPGEYTNYYGVHYDKYLDKIIVQQTTKVFLLYNHDGTFEKSVSIDLTNTHMGRMVVVDQTTWAFPYRSWQEDGITEVGVIFTDKTGKLLSRHDLTDKNLPGCYGTTGGRNNLYMDNNELFFSIYDYKKTSRFNGREWVTAISIDCPFPSPPAELMQSSKMMELNEFQRSYGLLLKLLQ